MASRPPRRRPIRGRGRAAGSAPTVRPGSGPQEAVEVIVMSKFENKIYTDADRLATLENRAAELERRLLLVTHPEGDAQPNAAVPYAVPGGGKRHAGAFKGGGPGGGGR